MSPKAHRLAVVAAFAAIYLVWGSTYLAIRVGLETLPPMLLAGIRFLVAGIPLYAWTQWGDRSRPSFADWRKAAALGLLLLVGGNGVVTWAEQRVPSGLAALLITAVPLWMALLDWLVFGGGRPGARAVAGLVLGPIGIGLLIGPGSAGGRVDPLGAALLMLSSLSWATGSLLGRRWTMGGSAIRTVSMEMIAGGVALTIAGSLGGEWTRLDPSAVSFRSIAALLYLSAFGSIVALSAYTWLLRVSSPRAVSTYAFVNPVVAVALGWALAGEALGTRTVGAAALILGAVVLLQGATTRPAKAGPGPVPIDVEPTLFDEPASELAPRRAA